MKKKAKHLNRGTNLQQVKALAQINGKDIFPEVKLPREVKRPKGMKYDNPEARLRKEVIAHLKKRGFRVYRIENSIGGKSTGIADLLVFKSQMYFIELKSENGTLQKNQQEFREFCLNTKTNYLVIRHIDELKHIY